MTISRSGIFTPDKNPAKTLYRYWLTILKGWHGDLSAYDKMAFGESSCEIGVAGFTEEKRQRPILALYYAGSPRLYIRPDGAFRIGYMTSGFNSSARQKLQANSFLDYHHDFGQYNWCVNTNIFVPPRCGEARLARPDLPNGQRWYCYFPVTRDWRQPIPYVPEDILAARTHWAESKPWMVCEPDDEFIWRIVPAAKQPGMNKRLAKALPVRWEGFVARREKRYRASERLYEIDAGLRPAPVQRHRTEVTDDMVARFAAAFDLSEPACITPLTRGPKEAHDAQHDVAAQEQLQP